MNHDLTHHTNYFNLQSILNIAFINNLCVKIYNMNMIHISRLLYYIWVLIRFSYYIYVGFNKVVILYIWFK